MTRGIANPAQHEAHEMPLAGRIIDRLISEYIAHAGDIALAGNGYSGAEEEGFRKGVEQMRYLHLSGWDYRLTPKIVDELTRAGLLQGGA